MQDGATHAGWLLMRGGTLLRRWQRRYIALFPAGAGATQRWGAARCRLTELSCLRAGTGALGQTLRYKRLPSDAAWLGALPLDQSSCGALPLGDGHPTAACFCAWRYCRCECDSLGQNSADCG
jgi:hypothetical protein